ncbi:MAG: transporter, family, tetracycline resistance protein [Acidobacteriota bacterium]|nr:transporter, family, tetracycline resistance protein [Acidobacteriota bacterium]
MRNWNVVRRILFLTVFIDLLGFGVAVPILAFSAKEYGASGMTLGLILGSFSLMQFFFSPIWGRLSDRIGRRPVIVGSLFGNVVGFSVFAFAFNVPMLFAARIITGIAAASVPTAQAYIADSTDEHNRAKGMALIGMAFGLGLVLGPPVGGILSSYGVAMKLTPNLLPGAAAAVLSTTALLMALFALPESRTPDAQPAERRFSPIDRETWSIFFRTRDLRLAGGALAILMCTLSSLAPILVLVGRDRFGLNARAIGYLLGLMGVVVVLLQFTTIHRLTQRIGDVGAATVGAVALVIGLLLVPFTTERAMLIAATLLMGVGQGLINPTLSSYISKVAPASHRGGILGLAHSLNALARVAGPPIAGLAYDAYHAPGALLAQSFIVCIGIAFAVRLMMGARPSTGAVQ